MHRILLILMVMATASAAAAAPRDGAAAAEAWLRQLHGFDAFEAYESHIGSRRVDFMVARRWKGGRAEVLIDIRAPRRLEKLAFLFLQNRNRSDDLFAYDPFWRRIRRLPAAELSSGRLPTGRFVTLGDLRPVLPGELVHESLPDEEVDGETCWGAESRPAGRPLGFDRMTLAISKRTGVALRTVLYRNGREFRRVLVSPGDVRLYDDRYLPRRRVIEVPEEPPAELLLRNLMIDPPFPDQLFSKLSLRTQRFPSF